MSTAILSRRNLQRVLQGLEEEVNQEQNLRPEIRSFLSEVKPLLDDYREFVCRVKIHNNFEKNYRKIIDSSALPDEVKGKLTSVFESYECLGHTTDYYGRYDLVENISVQVEISGVTLHYFIDNGDYHLRFGLREETDSLRFRWVLNGENAPQDPQSVVPDLSWLQNEWGVGADPITDRVLLDLLYLATDVSVGRAKKNIPMFGKALPENLNQRVETYQEAREKAFENLVEDYTEKIKTDPGGLDSMRSMIREFIAEAKGLGVYSSDILDQFPDVEFPGLYSTNALMNRVGFGSVKLKVARKVAEEEVNRG